MNRSEIRDEIFALGGGLLPTSVRKPELERVLRSLRVIEARDAPKPGEIRIAHTLSRYEGELAMPIDDKSPIAGKRRAADTVVIPMGDDLGSIRIKTRIEESPRGFADVVVITLVCDHGRLVVRPEVSNAINVRVER